MEQKTQQTALLVMDMEAGILSTFDNSSTLIEKVTKAIDHARKINIPVIYIRVKFRSGGQEISDNNKSFRQMKEKLASVDMEQFAAIEGPFAPMADEIIVDKKRVSGFAGSDLEMVLNAQGITHIVLTGIATSGVVLSTLRQAADMDFQITVLQDACADRDEEVHRVLMTKVFVRQADVITVEDWASIDTK